MDSKSRANFAEAGRRKLEEFRRKKALEQASKPQSEKPPISSQDQTENVSVSLPAAASASSLPPMQCTNNEEPSNSSNDTIISTASLYPTFKDGQTFFPQDGKTTVMIPPVPAATIEQEKENRNKHRDIVSDLLQPHGNDAFVEKRLLSSEATQNRMVTFMDASMPSLPMHTFLYSNQLFVNGNAAFTATMKEEGGGGDAEVKPSTIIESDDTGGSDSGHDEKKEGKGVESNSRTTNNTRRITTTLKDQSFKELQNHIGELTEEKFTLQKCLEQQTLLADRLASENESLIEQINSSTRAVEDMKIEVEVRQKEVALARAAVGTAMAERDAYEMSAREASERAKTLAVEVVALEEKVLRMKNEQMKQLREWEQRNGDHSGEGAIHAEIIQKERIIESLRGELESTKKEFDQVRREMREMEQNLKELKDREQARGHLDTMSRPYNNETTREEREWLVPENRRKSSIDQNEERIVDINGTMVVVRGDDDKSEAEGGNSEYTRSKKQHGKARYVTNKTPPPSAVIASEAMAAMIAAENDTEKEQDGNAQSIPDEILALLPRADTWTPGAQGLPSTIFEQIQRIYDVIHLLEKERSATATKLNDQKIEIDKLTMLNVELQRRLEAVQASRELDATMSREQ